ncbi:unnamed protein product [Clonostachys rosea f. rosea IK726]|uniref:Xylanolytic transcriptional activator regulatory domain-containing protein n=2 Tax=Bionectria ochroleuca TaxID=29856 RepID=A0A0B7KHB2_BIOOC|nr:unnamed protein product [Clonostachys rosea f. rosea IK726]
MSLSPGENAPLYSHRDTQTHDDVMGSLSLRRDLSHPENPPFGTWWTYTVEETLLWPILEYQGNINNCLDVILGDFDDEPGNKDTGASPNAEGNTGPYTKERRKQHLSSGITLGLDDGATISELVGSFLRNIHTKFPILEPQELRERGQNLVESGLGWDGETCQVLLACALGAISCPWDVADLENYDRIKPSRERLSLANEYFSAGQKRLGALLTQSSIIAVQCIFMAGLFLMHQQKPVAGWRLLNVASIACRTYISKRMARESRNGQASRSRSMEQRLCWSCFKTEREVACEFGMETSGLNVIAYSTSLPTPPNGFSSEMQDSTERQFVSSSATAATSTIQETYQDKSWYYFLTDIMLCKLEMRIDNYCQDKRREAYHFAGGSPEVFFRSMTEALQEFRYQLSSYYNSLPPLMQFPMGGLIPCEDEAPNQLRWRIYCVQHDIYIPALYILLHKDVSGWSHNLVNDLIDLANECIKLDVIFLKTAVTPHRQYNTWLWLRKGVRSALILIASRRLKAQRRPGLERLEVPDDATCADGARRLVQGLRYWSAESNDCKEYLALLYELHAEFRV